MTTISTKTVSARTVSFSSDLIIAVWNTAQIENHMNHDLLLWPVPFSYVLNPKTYLTRGWFILIETCLIIFGRIWDGSSLDLPHYLVRFLHPNTNITHPMKSRWNECVGPVHFSVSLCWGFGIFQMKKLSVFFFPLCMGYLTGIFQ